MPKGKASKKAPKRDSKRPQKALKGLERLQKAPKRRQKGNSLRGASTKRRTPPQDAAVYRQFPGHPPEPPTQSWFKNGVRCRGAPPRRICRKMSHHSGCSNFCKFCAVARPLKTANLTKLWLWRGARASQRFQEFPAPIGLKKSCKFCAIESSLSTLLALNLPRIHGLWPETLHHVTRAFSET